MLLFLFESNRSSLDCGVCCLRSFWQQHQKCTPTGQTSTIASCALTWFILFILFVVVVVEIGDLCELEVVLALLAHAVRVCRAGVPLHTDPAVLTQLPDHAPQTGRRTVLEAYKHTCTHRANFQNSGLPVSTEESRIFFLGADGTRLSRRHCSLHAQDLDTHLVSPLPVEAAHDAGSDLHHVGELGARRRDGLLLQARARLLQHGVHVLRRVVTSRRHRRWACKPKGSQWSACLRFLEHTLSIAQVNVRPNVIQPVLVFHGAACAAERTHR